MHHRSRFAIIIFGLVIAAVLIAGSANAADKKRYIELKLDVGSTAKPFIRVLPRDAKIWRNKPGKPKKVEWWWTTNKTSYSEIFWEIRYDPSKGGGTADYFGDVDIACGESKPDKKPDFPNAEWPYSITVYACSDGVKAQKIATLDPRIKWQD
jgi:hypothetical protein